MLFVDDGRSSPASKEAFSAPQRADGNECPKLKFANKKIKVNLSKMTRRRGIWEYAGEGFKPERRRSGEANPTELTNKKKNFTNRNICITFLKN